MEHRYGAVISLRDNFTATLRKSMQEQRRFKDDVQRVRQEMEKAYEKRREIRIQNSTAMRKLSEVSRAMEPLRKQVVTALAIKDMATSRVRAVGSAVMELGRKVASPVIKVIDKATSPIRKIGSSLLNLAKNPIALAIGTAGGMFGVGKMVSSGAMLEQQMISMGHFIGIQNQGMSQDEVMRQRDEYIKALRENANLTPFETAEVISAGTRALNVSGGDTGAAMGMLQIAQDMAALNPQATLEDAMEALAGLQMGETQRMKRFGFKISADDIASRGVDNIIHNEIAEFFAGGAQQLATSGAGLWSTALGKMGSVAQDTGYAMLEALKPALETIIAGIDKATPFFIRFGEGIANGIGFAVEKISVFSAFVSQYMPMIRRVMDEVVWAFVDRFGFLADKTDFLREVFSKTFSAVGVVMTTVWKVAKPILTLFAELVRLLFEAFEFAFPAIEFLVTGVWSIIGPILEAMGKAFEWIGKGVRNVANWLTGKNSRRGDNDAVEWEDSDSADGKHATGLARVPYDGYRAILHEGEQVLSKREAQQRQGMSLILDKLADTLIVREEADIDKITTQLVRKLELASMNAGVA